MRILHLASGDLWAGAEVMLCTLAATQSRQPGVEVAVVLFNEGRLANELRSAGLSVTVYDEARLNPMQLIMRTGTSLRQFQPDIVHTHRIKEDMIGAIAAALSYRKARLVRTVHGADEASRVSLTSKTVAAMHRWCIRLAFARSFAVARPLAAGLATRFGARKVCCIANGIDLARITALTSQEARRREADGPTHIGLAGRLVPIKRIDLFLQMAALLVNEDPEAYRFTIYGDGPESAGLHHLARQLGIADRVTFAGFCPDIIPELQGLDMLFLTSDSEGLPMVVLEAMALGLPVVVAAVGELPHVLAQGQCGTLVDRQEPEAYAHAARNFRAEPRQFAEMAAAARRRVETSYSSEACAVAYLREYARVIDRMPPALPELP